MSSWTRPATPGCSSSAVMVTENSSENLSTRSARTACTTPNAPKIIQVELIRALRVSVRIISPEVRRAQARVRLRGRPQGPQGPARGQRGEPRGDDADGPSGAAWVH